MGLRWTITSLLAVSVIMYSSASADDADSDNAKLQGTWKATSAISDGKKVEEPTLGEFTFSGDSFVMKGKRTLRGKFNLDSSKTPKHIDLNFTGENGAVVPSKAIYTIDGNTLTLCEADVGQPRPNEFKSVAGSKDSLIVLVKAQPQSAELKVLGQYVGDWTSEVTSKPTVFTPKEIKYRTSNHAEFVLDGRFLNHIEINQPVGNPKKVTKALVISTYDSQSRKYITWFFQSSGLVGKWTGEWNPTDKALVLSGGSTGVLASNGRFREVFPNESTINGTLSYTGNDGRTMFEMVWTRKRQAGIAGKPTRKQWSEIGTPIEPIPDEVKRLAPLVGTWDSEYVFRVPQRPAVKGVISDEWSLDGRFIMRRETVGDTKSIAMIGWDNNKRAYQLARAISSGRTNEAIGQWSETTRSFVWDWKVDDDSEGVTSVSTWRLVGNDAIQIHVVRERGKDVLLDLTIKLEQRK
jgi:uncharacterized protein (TIGR03067 family)